MSANRVFFPNLNGIRFLAALVVIIHHVEMAKYWFDLPNIYNTSFVGGVFGELGIILFFVLSGFLITYLLLEEHRRTGTIGIKAFYMRRILRIWPVYYLVVIFSLFILPNFHFFDIPGLSEQINDGFFLKSLAYMSFLPNLGYTLYEHIPYATQTWSVGVEEQFYLLWPVLMLYAVRRQKVLQALVATVVVYLLVKTAAVLGHVAYPSSVPMLKSWLFWDHFSIDCMALGGISAYLLFYRKEKVLKILYNKYLQAFLYTVLAIITLKGLIIPWYSKELFAIIFMVLILNLAANKNTIISLEYKPLNYLGKISYGLYMYHNFVLTLVLKLFMLSGAINVSSIGGGIIYHIVSLGLTIAVSALSYEYFEKWFLGIKTRYTRVQSGNEVAPPTSDTTPGIPAGAQPHTA
ncbi:MAG TPA: acyltransferase [Flavipsychrobacter sp.]